METLIKKYFDYYYLSFEAFSNATYTLSESTFNCYVDSESERFELGIEEAIGFYMTINNYDFDLCILMKCKDGLIYYISTGGDSDYETEIIGESSIFKVTNIDNMTLYEILEDILLEKGKVKLNND